MAQSQAQEAFLFSISGTIGTWLFYFFYEIVHYLVWWEPYKATFCWLFSYLVSIIWQMELHARIVFKTPITNYWKSLAQVYSAYAVSIGLSTVIDSVLVYQFGLDHRVAWFATLAITGVLNYYLVSNIMKPKKET
mmetsp:Transcript_15459/g.21555  ORF Transcript_15459/g.21555 Transcript_15459/m.21555 type:complete len:135 (+) Transcript_15459:57-461(+)